MKAGSSKICITSQIGIPLGGTFERTLAESVHDDIYARSLALEDGDQKMIISSADLEGLRPEFTAKVSAEIEKNTGVPASHIMFASTHNHSSHDILALMHNNLDQTFFDTLQKQLVQVCCEAWNGRKEVAARFGTGSVEGECTNRRIHVKGDKVRMNWENIPEEDIVSHGPIDPRLGVITLDATDGSPIAAILHFTCHAAVVSPEPRQVSSDYPGVVNRMIEHFTGEGRVCIFLNGAFGNINHILKPAEVDCMLRGTAPGLPFEEAERVGSAVAVEALRVIKESKPIDASMDVVFGVADMPTRMPPVDTVDEAEKAIKHWTEARDTAAKAGDEAARGEAVINLVYAENWKMMLERNAKTLPAPMRAFRIGPVAFATIPGEPFVEIGFDVQKRSKYPQTFVIGDVDYMGYIPTEESFPQGGYEVRTCGWSQFREDADKLFANEAVKLLEKLS